MCEKLSSQVPYQDTAKLRRRWETPSVILSTYKDTAKDITGGGEHHVSTSMRGS
jgi:hypothetical protein